MDKETYIAIENEAFVQSDHPELHHYTGWCGLSGIWTSGQLHATRYDCLNDRTEVEHFREIFTAALANKIKDALLEKKQASQKAAIEISKAGGAAVLAEKHAQYVSAGLFKSVFSISDSEGSFAVPYITSFCSHRDDAPYEQQNGLLSQWRGYSGKEDERYAIVFDTQGLVDMLTKEKESFDYTTVGIMDVVYNNDEFICEDRFAQLLRVATKRHMQNLYGEEISDEDAQTLLLTFTSAAARFKHRGFEEERELRVIGFVPHPTYVENLYLNAGLPVPAFRHKPTSPDEKKIHFFEWNKDRKLPIKRIIIGPHQNQHQLEKKVEDLVKGTVPIIKSETPYIG